MEWLREILPGKTTAELYMAIGCQKHAKTESYREYLHYITRCDEQFIEAPGIRGMVMLVFTLPGFDRVFKVIGRPLRAAERDDRRPCAGLLSAGKGA